MKKIISIIVAAVMMVTAMSVSVSAVTIFDTAKTISSGKTVKTEIARDDNADYKITVTKSGTLTINYTSALPCMLIYVMDADGANIKVNDVVSKSGSNFIYDNSATSVYSYYNMDTGLSSGQASYKVTKGTYYIRFHSSINNVGTNELSFKATFPSQTVSKISYLQITVPKGETLKLGAVISGSGTVTWSSSKPSVATVSSKGLITAKSKGFTIITAKLGSSSVKIRIKVTS